MKAVIIARGLGTRIAEETHLKLKPMLAEHWRGTLVDTGDNTQAGGLSLTCHTKRRRIRKALNEK